MRSWLITCLLLLPVHGVAKVRFVTLPNGLQVVLFPKDLPYARIEIGVHAGGKTELQQNRQLAHLTEHTVFRDPALGERTYLDILREAYAANAYTHEELTEFYAQGPGEKTKWMIETFGKVLKPRTFTAAQVESAKKEVEIEKGGGLSFLLAQFKEAYFQLDTPAREFGLPRRNPPFKFSERSVRSITRDQVQAFYEKYYHPKNMYLILAGDFETKSALKWIEQNFGGMSSEGKSVTLEAPPSPRRHPWIESHLTSNYTSRISIGTKWWDGDIVDSIVLKSYVLSLSARLMEELRSRHAAVYSVNDHFWSDTRRFGTALVTLDTPVSRYRETYRYVSEKMLDETRRGRISDAVIKQMRKAFIDDRKALSATETARKAYWLKKTFGTEELPETVLERVSDQEIRKRLTKLFTPEKEMKILTEPPIFFPQEGYLFTLMAIVAGCLLSWRWLRRPENEVRTVDYFVRTHLGLLGWGMLVLTVAALWLARIWIADRLFDTEPFAFIVRESFIVRIHLLESAMFGGLAMLMCWILSRLSHKMVITKQHLILRSRAFGSQAYALSSIESITIVNAATGVLRSMTKGPKRGHASYFGLRKGLLIETRSGECFFVGVREPQKVAAEIRSLLMKATEAQSSLAA